MSSYAVPYVLDTAIWRQKSHYKSLQPESGVDEVERQSGTTVGPCTPTVQGTAVVCNIEERQLEHNWYLHIYIYIYEYYQTAL